MSSLCGGVISESILKKDMKKYGVWADMMAWVMPDKQYDKYIALEKQGKDKQATKIFKKFARSQIG
jgi:hypothetical protein